MPLPIPLGIEACGKRTVREKGGNGPPSIIFGCRTGSEDR